jgi:sensor c-di-GMP phosphodiesterase-like protein
MRTVFQRTVVTVFSTIVLAALGTLSGYLLGRAIAIRQAESRLDQYANRVLADAASSSAESRAVLSRMNTSPYPACSDSEIAFFRKLVFQSQYLKAGGRIRNGRIECSTTLGRTDQVQAQYQPDISQGDGTKLFKNLPPFRVDDQMVIAIQTGDSFVVYNPYNLKTLAALPMRYAVTVQDAPTRQTGQLLGELPSSQGSDLSSIVTTEGKTRIGDSLYATRCSNEYATCMTAHMSVPDALLGSHRYITAFVALGGFSGVLLGLLCPLLYRRNKSVEQQLARAIRGDALTVVYQPIVDLTTGRIVEAEALVRWTDEYNNAVSPDVFVKVAEERGFVGDITKLVVRHVLRDFGSTMRARPDFRVNVNIAAADLGDSGFVPMLEDALFDAEISARSLGIEITESYTARRQVAKDTILRLRQKGHFVHIDDFGTGYSSLAYLHDLSVDSIKIDKAFTKAIGTDAVTVSILPQILTMAETLKLHVIVEGIETRAQANYFAAGHENVYGQGWLFGRPVTARLFLQILDEEESKYCEDPMAAMADKALPAF